MMASLLERYLESPAGQARSVDRTDHRPWPIPGGPWRMGQTWRHLLFAHWPIDAELLRRHVHPALPIDEFDGSAWLGITPFLVEALRMRGTLPLPLLSNFPELNIRTYATIDGKPGVVFLRLDTPSRAAIGAARMAYRLPYAHASLSVRVDDDGAATARSSRDDGTICMDYAPTGPSFEARPGTLEYFLTERYRLYTTGDDGHLRWAEIHHRPWPLREGRAEVSRHGYLPEGLVLEGDPLVHVADRQDVVIWPLSGPPRSDGA